jgi:hypothetical protein
MKDNKTLVLIWDSAIKPLSFFFGIVFKDQIHFFFLFSFFFFWGGGGGGEGGGVKKSNHKCKPRYGTVPLSHCLSLMVVLLGMGV